MHKYTESVLWDLHFTSSFFVLIYFLSFSFLMWKWCVPRECKSNLYRSSHYYALEMSFTGATYEFKVFYQRKNLVIALLYMHHLAQYGNTLFKQILFSPWKYTECVWTLPVMKGVRLCDIFCSHLTSLLLERRSQSLTFKPVPSAVLMCHSLKAILGPSWWVMPNCGIIFFIKE